MFVVSSASTLSEPLKLVSPAPIVNVLTYEYVPFASNVPAPSPPVGPELESQDTQLELPIGPVQIAPGEMLKVELRTPMEWNASTWDTVYPLYPTVPLLLSRVAVSAEAK